MKRVGILIMLMAGTVFFPLNARSQELNSPEGKLLIQEGKQLHQTYMTVEGYLNGDVADIIASVRMYAQRPRIVSVWIQGPKLGRLHHKSRTTQFAGLDEEGEVAITKLDGMFVSGPRTKTKKAKGTLAKELFQFKIPREKILSGKRYELVVEAESKSQGGQPIRFKFELKDFYELLQGEQG